MEKNILVMEENLMEDMEDSALFTQCFRHTLSPSRRSDRT